MSAIFAEPTVGGITGSGGRHATADVCGGHIIDGWYAGSGMVAGTDVATD